MVGEAVINSYCSCLLQDITGWGLTFVVHAYGDPNIIYISKTIGSGISVPTPSNGQATITIAAAVALPPGVVDLAGQGKHQFIKPTVEKYKRELRILVGAEVRTQLRIRR
jgi:hypothetical protein